MSKDVIVRTHGQRPMKLVAGRSVDFAWHRIPTVYCYPPGGDDINDGLGHRGTDVFVFDPELYAELVAAYKALRDVWDKAVRYQSQGEPLDPA